VTSHPSFSLAGRRALLTGAGGAIGTVLAKGVADSGASVVLQDLAADRVTGTCDQIRAHGGIAHPLASDLADPANCATVIDQATELLGGLDLLITCAGINRRKPIDEVSVDDFDAIVAVNMRSVFFLSQAAHAPLKAAGNGAIVHLSSLSARFSFNTIAVYAATKAAVSSMTRSFAREWAADNIRVNCIEPSVVKTEFTKPLWGEEHRQRWFDATTPIGRLSTPDEMLGAVLFLASDAASYITGQSIVIDGGILAGADWDSYRD
jgi:NAD(P)-dependent dehydrogenase (short-subunit alcohol dehydrogenase family)